MPRIRWMTLAIAPLLCGCVFMGGGRKSLHDGQRLEVRFETRTASNDFYAGLATADRSDFQDAGGFCVLFLAGGGGEVFHETLFYNSQVQRADVDRDGTITEAEAKGYREAVRPVEE